MKTYDNAQGMKSMWHTPVEVRVTISLKHECFKSEKSATRFVAMESIQDDRAFEGEQLFSSLAQSVLYDAIEKESKSEH